MRVLKSAKWVLSLVASGGVALVLSGQAMAADITADPSVVSDSSVQHQSVSGTDATSADVKIAVVQTANSSVSTPAQPTVGAVTQPPAVAPQTAVKEPPAVAVAVVPVVTVDIIPSQATVAMAKPADTAALAASPVAKTYTPVSLPIRSTVVSNRTTDFNDLASSLPTAAPAAMPIATDNKPLSPAVPTGALGQITEQLAGSVVKPGFMPTTSPVTAAIILTLTLLLTLFTSGVSRPADFFSSRRDGYAHAARSDVAVATFNILFATPSSLSYVTAARQHATHF